MGCSMMQKKKDDKTYSEAINSQQQSRQLESIEIERELFLQFYGEGYKIEKNPIIQRRAHSATPLPKKKD